MIKLIKNKNIDELINQIRSSDIFGQVLSQVVSRIMYEKIEQNMLENSMYSPNVSPVDILVLLILRKNKCNDCNKKDVEKYILNNIPELEYALYYSLDRMRVLGLIREHNNLIRITNLGKEVIDVSLKVRDDVIKMIEQDSFLSFLYDLENNKKRQRPLNI